MQLERRPRLSLLPPMLSLSGAWRRLIVDWLPCIPSACGDLLGPETACRALEEVRL